MAEERVLRYKSFQFFFFENTNMDVGEIPEGAICELHPTFILFDCGAAGWKTMIPLSCIRFMNVSDPVT